MNHEHLDENDTAWNLLKQSDAQRASSRFVDDVLRGARLSEEKPRFWEKTLSPFALGSTGLGFAAVAVLFLLASAGSSDAPDTKGGMSLEESLTTELIIAAAESPELMSDDELIDLLF